MKILKIDEDVFRFGFERNWDGLIEYYNNKGFDAMEFNGELNLVYFNITSLPDNLTVSEDLWLSSCKKLNSLPNNLVVGGDLGLSYTKITRLPDNLTVGGDLYLIDASIVIAYPNSLSIGGEIYK